MIALNFMLSFLTKRSTFLLLVMLLTVGSFLYSASSEEVKLAAISHSYQHYHDVDFHFYGLRHEKALKSLVQENKTSNYVVPKPDFTPTIALSSSQFFGNGNALEIRILVRELVNANSLSSNGIYVLLSKATGLTLDAYDPNKTSATGSIVENSKWSYLGEVSGSYAYEYIGTPADQTFPGLGVTAIGLSGTFSSNSIGGEVPIRVSIFDGSGGEEIFTNNKDLAVVKFSY